MKKIILSISLLSLSLSFIGGGSPAISYAQTTGSTTQYTLLEPLPCIGPGCAAGAVQETIDIRTYFVYIFGLAIAIAVFLAVVVITFAGFKYMTEESITKKGAAKEMIWNAILGLLGALGSWLILYTINPQLVDLSLVTVPKIERLNYNTDPLSNLKFQEYLSSQSAALQQNINTTTNQNAATAAAAQTAQNNLTTAGAALYASGCVDENGNDISLGDPDCVAKQKEYTDTQDTLTQLQNKSIVQETSGLMANAYKLVLGASPTQIGTIYGGSAQDFSQYTKTETDAIAKIKSQYDTATTKLGNDVASKNELLDQKNYYEASVINEYNTEFAINILTQKNNQGNTENIAIAQKLIAALQNGGAKQTPTGESISTINNTDLLLKFNTENQGRITQIQKAIGFAKTPMKQ
ncbi:MAG: pilin [bacterium]